MILCAVLKKLLLRLFLKWDSSSPIFKFLETVKKVIHTTNGIESLNSISWKLNRQRSAFSSDIEFLKALYLATFEAKNGQIELEIGDKFTEN